MNREMQHIDVLAGEIGFRVATTEGEQRAAEYIEQELQSYGLQDVRQEAFPCTTEAMNSLFPYLLALLGSVLIAPIAPLLGLSGMLATPALMMSEQRLNRGPAGWLTRKGTSHNVIGVLPAKGECKARVVLMAHYDSVRVRGYMKPKKRNLALRLQFYLFGLSYFTALASTIVGLLARRKKQTKLARSAGRIAGVAGATTLTAISPILAGQMIRGVDGEGANDNASGVAVLLSLAEQMAQEPLENTEVWFVATGGEEIGLIGARALLQRYGKTLKDAYFLAIGTVGAGRIHYTTQEQFTRRSDVPHEMVDILVTASEKGQHRAMPIALRGGATDASTALDKRHKAASICCLVKDGKWPEINWLTDTRQYVEADVPPKVTAFVKNVLQEINQRVCYNKEHKNHALSAR